MIPLQSTAYCWLIPCRLSFLLFGLHPTHHWENGPKGNLKKYKSIILNIQKLSVMLLPSNITSILLQQMFNGLISKMFPKRKLYQKIILYSCYNILISRICHYKMIFSMDKITLPIISQKKKTTMVC